MKVTLKVWRQKNGNAPGGFVTYETPELNRQHVVPRNARRGERRTRQPAAKNRSRSITTAAKASAARARWSSTASRTARIEGVATCQTYMRSFKDGDAIVVEPFRAKAVSAHQRPGRGSQGL